MGIIEYGEEILHILVSAGVVLLEFIGWCVLMVTTVKCLIGCFKKDPRVRINLGHGIALALEFKMGGEVLKTVIVHEWDELIVLGAIVVVRAAITFLIHWEVKNEEKHFEEEERHELEEERHHLEEERHHLEEERHHLEEERHELEKKTHYSK